MEQLSLWWGVGDTAGAVSLLFPAGLVDGILVSRRTDVSKGVPRLRTWA